MATAKEKNKTRPNPMQHGRHSKNSLHKPWTRRRIVSWSSVGVSILAVLAYGVFLGSQVLTVKADLESVQLATATIKQQLKDKDIAGLKQSLIAAELATSDARIRTDTLAWKAVEWIPVLGDNMRAVRVVSVQADSLLKNLVLPVVKALPANGQLPHGANGNLDFTFIDTISPIIEGSAGQLTTAKKELNSIKSPNLLPQVSSALEKFQKLADVAEPLPETTKVLRATLGMDKPITIALVAQNNAEAAALGGNSASITIMRVDKGDVSIEKQISQRDLPLVPVNVDIPQETVDLHSEIMLLWANAATFRPDFPTTAAILNAHLVRDLGVQPDAYVSIDPLALAKIVGATGPITLTTGDVLTEDNAVSLLLNEIYFRYPDSEVAEKTDEFFSEVAAEILGKIKEGDFDVWEMVTAVSESASQGSVMAWFANTELQKIIETTIFSGALSKTNTPETQVGVFFRDNSSSKIDYYLETTTELTSSSCTGDEDAEVSVRLHSTLTEAQAASLPGYVKSGMYGADYFQTKAFVYAPVGAEIKDIEITQISKSTILEKEGVDLNRNVAKFSIDLRPGETAEFKVKITGAKQPTGLWKLRATPMINGKATTKLPDCVP